MNAEQAGWWFWPLFLLMESVMFVWSLHSWCRMEKLRFMRLLALQTLAIRDRGGS